MSRVAECALDNFLESRFGGFAIGEGAVHFYTRANSCYILTACWPDYVGPNSFIIPNRYQNRVLQRVQGSRRVQCSFPMRYRCNILFRLRKLLSDTGFEHAGYGYESEPRYLAFLRLAFKPSVLHKRYSSQSGKLSLFAFGRSI